MQTRDNTPRVAHTTSPWSLSALRCYSRFNYRHILEAVGRMTTHMSFCLVGFSRNITVGAALLNYYDTGS